MMLRWGEEVGKKKAFRRSLSEASPPSVILLQWIRSLSSAKTIGRNR